MCLQIENMGTLKFNFKFNKKSYKVYVEFGLKIKT